MKPPSRTTLYVLIALFVVLAVASIVIGTPLAVVLWVLMLGIRTPLAVVLWVLMLGIVVYFVLVALDDAGKLRG